MLGKEYLLIKQIFNTALPDFILLHHKWNKWGCTVVSLIRVVIFQLFSDNKLRTEVWSVLSWKD